MSVIFYPEMSDAGAEALKEAREKGADDVAAAVMVYMAMSAVFELVTSADDNKTRH